MLGQRQHARRAGCLRRQNDLPSPVQNPFVHLQSQRLHVWIGKAIVVSAHAVLMLVLALLSWAWLI
jgi:hypothetical protein